MDEKPPVTSNHPAVRWRLEDLEGQQAQPTARPGLKRARSRGSMSIRSIRSSAGDDPGAGLAIQYRTVFVPVTQPEALLAERV
jgi:sodium/potassium-transporting ATPase subunit alpha